MSLLPVALQWFRQWFPAFAIPACLAATVATVASLPGNRGWLQDLDYQPSPSVDSSEDGLPFSSGESEIEVEFEDIRDVELSVFRYLNELTEQPILGETTLERELGLDDEDLSAAILALLAANDREYTPGLFTYPLITVEDLVLYIESSSLVEAEVVTAVQIPQHRVAA